MDDATIEKNLNYLKCVFTELVRDFSLLSASFMGIGTKFLKNISYEMEMVHRYIFYLEHPCQIVPLFYDEIEAFIRNHKIENPSNVPCVGCK